MQHCRLVSASHRVLEIALLVVVLPIKTDTPSLLLSNQWIQTHQRSFEIAGMAAHRVGYRAYIFLFRNVLSNVVQAIP